MDLDSLPDGAYTPRPEVIVSAANSYINISTGERMVIPSVRHYDNRMRDIIESMESILDMDSEIQGFVTSKYRFLTREEAWKLAITTSQIICRVGGDSANGGRLFSENIY